MCTVVIASKNPIKIQATLSGFRRIFPDQEFSIEMVSVPSGVNEQPLSNEEALRGAENRALAAFQVRPVADYWVGIEGGIEESLGGMTAFAWIVVRSQGARTSTAIIGRGRTGTFFLPQPVAELIRQGKELGVADDIVFNRSNSKQDSGAVGILTGNVINRAQLYEQAVILALIPFRNPEMYLVR